MTGTNKNPKNVQGVPFKKTRLLSVQLKPNFNNNN